MRTELTLKTPRSRDPVLGGSRDKIFVNVWIPDGVKVVRGAICNPFSKDEPVSKHWQAACRLWKFAYVQVDFDAVKKEEFTLLQTALVELAKKSNHPEIEHMPFCWLGMSRGGGMSMQMSELMPERTIAAVPVCLEVGPSSEATRQIPVMTVFGEKDGSQMEKLLGKLPVERELDARWSIAVQWGRKHEFALANNLSFVFFDDVIARRLPKEPDVNKPAALNSIPIDEGWIGNQTEWSKDGKRPTIQAILDFKGDRSATCWFPSERSAAVWQAFVSASKDITVKEPAGLGDGQPFSPISAAKPVQIKWDISAKSKPSKIRLWDAHVPLAEFKEVAGSMELTLKPGIHSLIVTAEEGKVVRTSRPQTIVVAE